MKKINLLITLLLASNLLLFSQGKPHVKIFTNFNYDISSDGGESEFKEFELKRSY